MKRLHRIGGGGPAAYWAVMAALTKAHGSFTSQDIVQRVKGAARNTITCYVTACVRAGHVEALGFCPPSDPRGRRHRLYAVKVTDRTDAPFERTERSPKLGAGQQQMWTAMRSMPQFTTRDLAVIASTDEVTITPSAARKYCWALKRAGYLQEFEGGGRWAVMRLRPSMNKGPLPPALRGDDTIVERNVRRPRVRVAS